MQLIKVAAAAVNQTPLAWDQNQANIRRAISLARAQDVTLLCLPELCTSGYGCEDSFHSRGVIEQAWRVLTEVAPASAGMIVTLGLPIVHRAAVYNAAALLVDGKIAGLVAKRFLAGDGIHYEPRWFRAWPEGKTADWRHDGARYRLGDLMFEVGGLRIGFEICEDAWVPNRPGGRLAGQGADFILNLSASHFAFGRHEHRRRLVIEASRAFGTTYIYANLLGNESGRVIYGGDTLIASCGTLLAAGPRFGFESAYVSSCVVDVDATRLYHARTASFQPTVEDPPGSVVEVAAEFARARVELGASAVRDPAWARERDWKFEEFTRAEGLALYDYLRKSRLRGFVISLSGGADSAACACLVYYAIALAVRERGLAPVCTALGYDPKAITSLPALMRRLLTCVYQATRNSSETTRAAAEAVATAVGADYLELDVDALVEGYTSMVSAALRRPLTWERDDIALQNIQARARAPGVWMIANIRHALLLATSNRSEAAVGYATMDGDTSGSLSPIAGIDKATLREWLRWAEAEGPEGVGPIPALRTINAQQPTAELRPQEEGQTDEGDLMPYAILDAIERAAIRDKLPPRDCYRRLRASHEQLSKATLFAYIERFFKLWSRNQWKRERYAPSFHLDDENLDPKTWCRFPILSGGFRRELEELRGELGL
ncbi:MAG: NAD(+) synthase [Myxococcales bacterium]|nr:NAD(+) synthase [Myxococcales bacterium]MCB9755589.1 NAD(+) synthase [Myxococcales bacterium]